MLYLDLIITTFIVLAKCYNLDIVNEIKYKQLNKFDQTRNDFHFSIIKLFVQNVFNFSYPHSSKGVFPAFRGVGLVDSMTSVATSISLAHFPSSVLSLPLMSASITLPHFSCRHSSTSHTPPPTSNYL